MPTGDLVSSVLWLSHLSPACDLAVVKQIWHTARQRNLNLGLTGTMVFDGERFCELLEGPVLDISAVYRDVEFDTRHVDLRVLHMSLGAAPRQLADWRSGYCDGPALDIFCSPGGLQGEAAMAAFIELLPHCNLSP
ncbi:MAG: BLUF domain-containing protein [Rhizobacter sp.]